MSPAALNRAARSTLVGACRLLLRIYFRRIQVVGAHHLPASGGLVLALNHPNGLIDPLFVLCLSGRRVSFLAKEPLFRMPVVGWFVRAFECLPVYREQDGADPARNARVIERAVELLSQGNALSLFPEGTSHSDPKLKPLKTGAARIALSAAQRSELPVYLVPAVLYYEQKETFRSRAVLTFGREILVPPGELDEQARPPRQATRELTEQLSKGLEQLLPTAEERAHLSLAEEVERLVSTAILDTPQACPTAVKLCEDWDALHELTPEEHPSLGRRMLRRRRLIDAYQTLTRTTNEEVRHLLEEMRSFVQELRARGLSLEASGRVRRASWLPWAVLFVIGFPIWLAGVLIHAPAYQLVRHLGFHLAKQDVDVLSTVKLLAGSLLFPLTWIALAAAAAWQLDAWGGLLFLILGPVLGWLTLWLQESLERARLSKRRRLSVAGREPETMKTDSAWSPQRVRSERAQLAERAAQLMSGSLGPDSAQDVV